MADDARSRGGFHGSASRSDRTSGFTGRHVVVFSDDLAGADAAITALKEIAGVYRPALSRDYASGADSGDPPADADAVIFERLGVAVVSAAPDRAGDLARAVDDARVLAVEPERILYAIEEPPLSLEYVRGFRDGVSCLYDQLKAGGPDEAADPGFSDNDSFTWGLQATRASDSLADGRRHRRRGTRHRLRPRAPRLRGPRRSSSQSFVAGRDRPGRPRSRHALRRHLLRTARPHPAVAATAWRTRPIFAGKVLSDAGSGTDARSWPAWTWALTNGVAGDLDVARRRRRRRSPRRTRRSGAARWTPAR